MYSIYDNNVKLIQSKYVSGVYSLQSLTKLVEIQQLSKEDFKDISGYEYEGVKKSRGW
jgi:hypothetical protein